MSTYRDVDGSIQFVETVCTYPGCNETNIHWTQWGFVCDRHEAAYDHVQGDVDEENN